MKNQLLCLLLFFTTLAGAGECAVPKPFRLLDTTTAEKFETANLRRANVEQPELVNLWATWCAPCRKELPFLQQVSEAKTATITLINIDDKPADAEKVLSELKIKMLKTAYEPFEFLDDLGVQGLPTSVVFHRKNIYLGVGMLKDEARISDWLACLNEQ